MVAAVISMPSAPDPELVAIAKRINAMLKERGWTPEKLAGESGVPFSTLSTYLSANPPEIKVRRAIRMAHALGVTVEEMVLGEEAKHRGPKKKSASG